MNSLDVITPDELEKARAQALSSIRRIRREADALRKISARFDGAFCTRRLLPQLLSLFPDAQHAWLSDPDYGGNISLTIGYAYPDRVTVSVCSADCRRIDGARLSRLAAQQEAAARTSEDHLARLEEAVSAYNAIAAQYAEIYSAVREFIPDIPYADYALRSAADARRAGADGITLRRFAAMYA